MSVANHATRADGGMPPATVKVWDLFVRLFHWSLVALFVVAYATGDEVERVHIAAGYAIAALLALRIIWGFVGPRHARFRSFVGSPGEVLAYLRDVLLFKAPRHLGHNPAGGLMIVALIAMLVATCATGYMMIVALIAMLVATCATGYMMTTDAYWGAKWVEEMHEVLANATVALIGLHVLGVVVASFQHRENLVKAMVTGRKRERDPAQFR
jgi:cytochrome b